MAGHYSKVVVCGAGVMGHSLAVLHARKSEVWLTDISESALSRAVPLMRSALETMKRAGALDEATETVMARIHCSLKLPSCLPGADLVVEAISENAETKRSFFTQLIDENGGTPLLESHAIVASNTSSLDIFALAPAPLKRRLYGAHHFVPPHIIPLTEIAQPDDPFPGTTDTLLEHYRSVGAVPVLLDRFCPGFIINRIQTAIHREMFKIIEEQIVDAQKIDLAVKASLGIRIPALGILKRLDFAGLDIVAGNMTRLGLTPPAAVSKLIAKGDYGVKSGKGFYDYTDRSMESIFEERDKAMLLIRRTLEDANLLSGHEKETSL
jgi:3-hydroxyacyl-CoA dehydrogenase